MPNLFLQIRKDIYSTFIIYPTVRLQRGLLFSVDTTSFAETTDFLLRFRRNGEVPYGA